MMTSNVGLGELVRDLRATLEAISLGLTDCAPEHLLDAEPRLAEIAARLASLATDDAGACRDEILAARAELRRCEQLGSTVSALGEVYAARQGYGPTGHFLTTDAAGVLQARG
jgi:hypothetical protein